MEVSLQQLSGHLYRCSVGETTHQCLLHFGRGSVTMKIVEGLSMLENSTSGNNFNELINLVFILLHVDNSCLSLYNMYQWGGLFYTFSTYDIFYKAISNLIGNPSHPWFLMLCIMMRIAMKERLICSHLHPLHHKLCLGITKETYDICPKKK